MRGRVFYFGGDVGVRFRSFAPRPTRAAAGMAFTRDRARLATLTGQVRRVADESRVAAVRDPYPGLILATRGTLDILRRYAGRLGGTSLVERAPCPCCGAERNVFRLTAHGRAALEHARWRRDARTGGGLWTLRGSPLP